MNTTSMDLKLGNFNGDKCADIFRISGSVGYVSFGVGPSCYKTTRESWQPYASGTVRLSDIKLGDFNGDGKTDIVFSSSGSWLVTYDGLTWKTLASSAYLINQLAVGDFNGDGKDDLMRSEKGWFYAPTGTGKWLPLLLSGIPLKEMVIGDFNGDGKSDILVVR